MPVGDDGLRKPRPAVTTVVKARPLPDGVLSLLSFCDTQVTIRDPSGVADDAISRFHMVLDTDAPDSETVAAVADDLDWLLSNSRAANLLLMAYGATGSEVSPLRPLESVFDSVSPRPVPDASTDAEGSKPPITGIGSMGVKASTPISHIGTEPLVTGDTYIMLTPYDASGALWVDPSLSLSLLWEGHEVECVWRESVSFYATSEEVLVDLEATPDHALSLIVRDATTGDTVQSLSASLVVAPHSTPFSREAVLPSHASQGGVSTDIEGEWLAVGYPSANEGAGEVLLYRLGCGVWELAQTLLPSTLPMSSASGFGHHLSVSGTRLAVSVSYPSTDPDTDGEMEGAVAVFSLSLGVWEYETVYTPSCPVNSSVGLPVALSPTHLAVGGCAFGATTGVVYVYTLGDDSGVDPEVLTGPLGTGHFGLSLSLDTYTLAVGSYCPAETGRVFEYDTIGGEWVSSDYALPDTDTHSWHTVSVSGDTLSVGNPMHTVEVMGEGVEGAGAVYMYSRASGVWQQEAIVSRGEEAQQDDWFGLGALSLDTSDGTDRLAVTHQHPGYVSVFERDQEGEYVEVVSLSSSESLLFDAWNTVSSPMALQGDTLVVAALGVGGTDLALYGPSGYTTSVSMPPVTVGVHDAQSLSATVLGTSGVADGVSNVVFCCTSEDGETDMVPGQYVGGTYTNETPFTVESAVSSVYAYAWIATDTCHPHPSSPFTLDQCMYLSDTDYAHVVHAEGMAVSPVTVGDTTVRFSLTDSLSQSVMTGDDTILVGVRWSDDDTYSAAEWLESTGVFEASVQAPSLSGAHTLYALVDGAEVSAGVDVLASPAGAPTATHTTLSPSPLPAVAGVPSQLEVQLVDDAGTVVVSSACEVRVVHAGDDGDVMSPLGSFDPYTSLWALSPTFTDVATSTYSLAVLGCGYTVQTPILTGSVSVQAGGVSSLSTLVSDSAYVGGERTFNILPIDSWGNPILSSPSATWYACLVPTRAASACAEPLIWNGVTQTLDARVAAPDNIAGAYSLGLYPNTSDTVPAIELSVSFTVGSPSPLGSSLTPSAEYIAPGEEVGLTLLLGDAYGNRYPTSKIWVMDMCVTEEGESTVCYNAVYDTSAGTYSLPSTLYLYGTGTTVIEAINPLDVVLATTSVVVGVGDVSASDCSVDTTTCAAGELASVAVTVLDRYGNVVPDLTGHCSVEGLTSDALVFDSDTLLYTVASLAVPESVGTYTLYVQVGDVSLEYPISVHPGQVSKAASSLSLSSTVVGSTSTATLTLFDAYSNPISTEAVSLGYLADGSDAVAMTAQGTGGVYTLDTLVLPTTVGECDVVVTVGDGTQDIYTFPVSLIAGNLSLENAVLGQDSYLAGSSAVFQVSLFDAYGNTASSDGVSVSAGFGSSSAALYSLFPAVPASLGYVSAAKVPVPQGSGSASLHIVVGTESVSFPVSILPDAPSPAASVLTVPDTLYSPSEVDVIVHIRDCYGNPVADTSSYTVSVNATAYPLVPTPDSDSTYTASLSLPYPGDTLLSVWTEDGTQLLSQSPSVTAVRASGETLRSVLRWGSLIVLALTLMVVGPDVFKACPVWWSKAMALCSSGYHSVVETVPTLPSRVVGWAKAARETDWMQWMRDTGTKAADAWQKGLSLIGTQVTALRVWARGDVPMQRTLPPLASVVQVLPTPEPSESEPEPAPPPRALDLTAPLRPVVNYRPADPEKDLFAHIYAGRETTSVPGTPVTTSGTQGVKDPSSWY
ncbi:hypothetical protein KIPB_005757 [Kipferlia bialata]|uniref:Uncharacterized protein n=1 Tax=Kipferlia bialata TaxID=797122 RepID=A0A9K3CVY2_9EUKA|nr:hypothetical protein KIPB_005757 [Kipferlia bialata]|eukprot:g5757.t1